MVLTKNPTSAGRLRAPRNLLSPLCVTIGGTFCSRRGNTTKLQNLKRYSPADGAVGHLTYIQDAIYAASFSAGSIDRFNPRALKIL